MATDFLTRQLVDGRLLENGGSQMITLGQQSRGINPGSTTDVQNVFGIFQQRSDRVGECLPHRSAATVHQVGKTLGEFFIQHRFVPIIAVITGLPIGRAIVGQNLQTPLGDRGVNDRCVVGSEKPRRRFDQVFASHVGQLVLVGGGLNQATRPTEC